MNKLYFALDRLCGNRWFPLLFIPIAVCFLLLYSTSTSPFYLWDGCDSVIFKTMGLAVIQGKIPYRDIFDHKGPVLYLIEALGQWMIPGNNGILILQCLSLSVTLLFLFKMAKLFVNSILSFIWVIVALGIMGVFFEGGNVTEEWNLPYLVIPSYYAMANFTRNSDFTHPYKYALIYGLCFGMSFFIRPNDAVAQVGGVMLGVTLWMLYQKQYENMFKNVLFFALGFIIIALPIIVWFGVNGALGDLFYGLIQFNGKYSYGLLYMVRSAIGKDKLKFFMFFVVLIVMVYNTTYKKLLVLLLSVLSLVVVFMGTKLYPHYYIVVAPYFMLFFVFLCLQKNKSIILCSIAVILASHIDTLKIARKTPKTNIKHAVNVIKNGIEESPFYEETGELLELVPDNERNTIWNYNLDFHVAMLWHQGLTQINKVPLYSMYQVDERLKEDDNIILKRPKYVLFSEVNSRDSLDYKFIVTNYELVAKTDTSVCNITLFKKR